MEKPSQSTRVRNAVLGCNLKNDRMICLLPRQTIQYHSIQVYAPTSNAEEADVEWFYEDLKDLLELTPKKDVPFIAGDWNANIGSQEIPGVTGKFGLGVQNEAGQRLIDFCQENPGHSKHPLPITQENTTHGHHQMVNTEIRRIIFFAAKDGQALHNRQKENWELTAAQIMNFL